MDLTTAPTHGSYTDYIASLQEKWPELQWLQGFFTRIPEAPQGTVTVIDATDEQLFQQVFASGNQGVEAALKAFSPDVKTKIVVVSYQEVENLDRQVLDKIGLAYDIDPLFYWHHLDTRREDDDEDENGEAPIKRKLLPSQSRALEFGYPYRFFASICFLNCNPENKWTILILLRAMASGGTNFEFERPSISNISECDRAIGSQRVISRQYQTILESWKPAAIQSANKTPIEFVYPLARLLAVQIADALPKETLRKFERKAFQGGKLWVKHDFEFETSVFCYALHHHREAIRTSLQSLNSEYSTIDWLAAAPKSPLGKALIHDFQSLSQAADERINELLLIESRSINHRSLQAQVRSAEQSDGIARITVLAFFFIPLSFATSIFGMNVQEFGADGVRIWIVIATSAGLMATVITLWITSRYISKAIRVLRVNLDGVNSRKRVLKSFAAISPLGAFWLLVYSFTHNPDYSTQLIRELGIYYQLGLGFWEEPDYGTSRQRVPLSRFWRKRADAIYEITRHRGWEKWSFYKRWGRPNSDFGQHVDQATTSD